MHGNATRAPKVTESVAGSVTGGAGLPLCGNRATPTLSERTGIALSLSLVEKRHSHAQLASARAGLDFRQSGRAERRDRCAGTCPC